MTTKHIPWRRRLKIAIVQWALDGVPVTDMKIGRNTITGSPGGVDVFRWSGTQAAAAAGDLGMNTSTGRPSAYIGGSAKDLATQAEVMLLDGTQAMTAALDAGSNQINNVSEPDVGTDAATKNYVDSRIAGSVDVGDPDGAGYIGTASITEINGLSPTTGDCVVAEDAGTPTAGTSDALSAGDLAEYDGTSWKQIVANSGGFPPSGTRALVATSSTFVSGGGLTGSTDEGKIARWGGAALTPTALTSPTDGVIVTVKGEGAVSENKTLVFDGAVPTGAWTLGGGAAASDHGGLTGLSDDDHPIYALLAGRTTGQTLRGGTNSGANLTLSSTAHATKGAVIIESATNLVPGTNNSGECGTSSAKWNKVHAQEVVMGDQVYTRTLDDGTPVRWRVQEYPWGFTYTNEISGAQYTLPLRRRPFDRIRSLLGV